MKSFLKIVLGSCIGTLLGAVLIGVVGFVALIALSVSIWKIAEQKQTSKAPVHGTVLELNINFEIPEYLDKDPFNRIDFNTFELKQEMGLDSLLLSLDKAARDDRLQGIYLTLEGFGADWSTAWEIRQALSRFKASGKWILCYGEQYNQKQFYVASIADEIVLHPQGELSLTGMSMESVFFGRLFKQLGIEVQTLRGMNNIYKSAVEPFTREEFSAENKEQMQVIVDGFWSVLSADIIEERGLNSSEFDEIVKTLGPRNAEGALASNLVDQLLEEGDIEDVIENELSVDFNDPERMNIFEYSKHLKVYPTISNSVSEKTIAIIHADGPIQATSSQDRIIHSSTINKWIKEAVEDETVKGIIVRVNSPGGGAFASELIYSEIAKAQEVKPVMVSFANMAASGGYYMSCASSNISATPLTLTGSIGVFGILPALEKFLEEKLYITHDGVKTHPFADAMNGMRPLSVAEHELIQMKINDVYSLFKKRVSEGRSMSENEVEKVARGRVWTGIDAVKNGLVDHTGGLLSVLGMMNDQLGITEKNHQLKVWPKELEWKDWVKEFDFENTFVNLKIYLRLPHARTLDMFESMRNGEKLQARLPYVFEIE